LQDVFNRLGIGCRALYVGQPVECSQRALQEWQSTIDDEHNVPQFPALLVEAGMAASGLTLTAASKMFFMEPFLREELQACTCL
jgi:hypothetical protein